MEELREFVFQVHSNRSRLYPLSNTCEEWKRIYRDFETKGKFTKTRKQSLKSAVKSFLNSLILNFTSGSKFAI